MLKSVACSLSSMTNCCFLMKWSFVTLSIRELPWTKDVRCLWWEQDAGCGKGVTVELQFLEAQV